MSFKVGDTVKLMVDIRDGRKGERNYFSRYVGQIYTVTKVSKRKNEYYKYQLDGVDNNFSADELKKFDMKKMKYILQYELDKDPIELFEELKDVKRRIEQLMDNESLKHSSLVVYEIAKAMPVKIKKVKVIEGI